jgi:hypothetical protein
MLLMTNQNSSKPEAVQISLRGCCGMDLKCAPQRLVLLGGDGTVSRWGFVEGSEVMSLKEMLGSQPNCLSLLPSLREVNILHHTLPP